MVVEEVDLLVTMKGEGDKGWELLYNLGDWCQQVGSRLVVVVTSNQMDIESSWPRKVASRAQVKRVLFRPYGHQQMGDILLERLEQAIAFIPNPHHY